MQTQLAQAIIRLGPTDAARAQKLGMSRRTTFEWRTGKIPRPIRQLMENLDLARAVVADAEALAAQKTVPADQPTTTGSVGEGA